MAECRARFAPARSVAALALLSSALFACSPAGQPPDSGVPPPDAGAGDAGVAMTAVLSLLELASSDGGVHLLGLATIGPRPAAGGCVVGPRTPDSDGAWLRIAGYRLGGQPTVCTNEDGGYVCRVPSGAEADLGFASGSDPLGPGPILFAVGGGADMGPATVSLSPAGTLSAVLDGATLHLTCAGDCSGDRVAVLAAGLSCDLPFAAELALPAAPAAVSVARVREVRGGDGHGAVLVGRTGRGVTLP